MSPDGSQIAFARSPLSPAADLFIVPLEGGTARRIASETNFINGLAWTPDGKALSVANSTGEGTTGSPIVIVKADGSGLSAVPGIDTAIDPTWRPE